MGPWASSLHPAEQAQNGIASRPKQRSRIETNLEVRISNEFGEEK
jgi:hypothetical protein